MGANVFWNDALRSALMLTQICPATGRLIFTERSVARLMTTGAASVALYSTRAGDPTEAFFCTTLAPSVD